MVRVFASGGPMMFPMLLIALVVLGLTVRTAVELVRRRGANAAVVQNGLDGLLFWGLFAFILGVLGQVSGYYRSMLELTRLGLASPQHLWLGIAEGFVSPIAGLVLLALAGLSWYVLRWRSLRLRSTTR